MRRLDSLLEGTKEAVLGMKASLDKAGVAHQDQALRQAAGQAFYNTSGFTLRELKARASQQKLKADFEAWLDGFSPNVQEILENFEFRNQIPRLSKADALGTLIEKLLSPDINLSPRPVFHGDGSVKHPGLDNHAMGTGGMLTVAEETLKELAARHGKQVATHLYGQEINAETYAICKADLLVKGEGDAADNIVGGPEHSTLANDAFPSHEFEPDPLRGLFAAKVHGKPAIVEYEPDSDLRDTEQVETEGLLAEIIGGGGA